MIHLFSRELAVKYGVKEAIVLWYLEQSISYEKASNSSISLHEGRYWTHETLDEMAKGMPYFSKRTIQNIIKRLVEQEVVLKGNYGDNPFDRTCWYSIDLEVVNNG